MREALLLGAGASVEAGVPATFDMTRQIFAEMPKDGDRATQHRRVLTYVIGGLLYKRGQEGDDPFDGVDVERLFAAVNMLADRTDLDVAPFLGGWHPKIEELERGDVEGYLKGIAWRLPPTFLANRKLPAGCSRDDVLGRPFNPVAHSVRAAIQEMTGIKRPGDSMYVGDDIGFALDTYTTEKLRGLVQVLLAVHDGRVFRSTAEEIIQALRRIAWIPETEAERVSYLEPILSLHKRQERLVATTLNFDNAFELLATRRSTKVNTGIEEWSEGSAFNFGVPGLHLLKLHGSVDWEIVPGGETAEMPLPRKVVKRLDATEVPGKRYWPAVVFGHGSKLTTEGPFLDLLREFQRELGQTDVLTVVGYSFRDAHINEYITQWINGASGRTIRVIAPQFPRTGYAEMLRKALGKRLTHIAEPASKGLLSAGW